MEDSCPESCKTVFRLMKIARAKMKEYKCDFGDEGLDRLYKHMLSEHLKKNFKTLEIVDEEYKDIMCNETDYVYRPHISDQNIKDELNESYEQIEKMKTETKKRIIHLSLIPILKSALVSIDEVNNCLFETNNINIKYVQIKKKLEIMRKENDQKNKQTERRYEFRKRSLEKNFNDDVKKQKTLFSEI